MSLCSRGHCQKASSLAALTTLLGTGSEFAELLDDAMLGFLGQGIDDLNIREGVQADA
jgi:hypothetical protein